MDNILYDVTSTQPVADMLKAIVSATRPADSVEARDRRRALRLISLFEGQDWCPELFIYALNAKANGMFSFAPVGVLYTPDAYSDDPQADLLADVVDVLLEYIRQLTPACWEKY